MKLIIDIPDKIYKFIKDRGHLPYAVSLANIIEDGIPYEEEPKGKWIIHNDYNENCRYGCNQCGNLTNRNSSFCPDCGTKMEGDKLRPKGKWILDNIGYYCSKCKKHPDITTDYCPFCGADMRGDV